VYEHLTGQEVLDIAQGIFGDDFSSHELLSMMGEFGPLGSNTDTRGFLNPNYDPNKPEVPYKVPEGNKKEKNKIREYNLTANWKETGDTRRDVGLEYGTSGTLTLRGSLLQESGQLTNREAQQLQLFEAIQESTQYSLDAMNELYGDMNTDGREDQEDALNTYLDEIVGTQTVSGWGSTVAPGFNEDEMQATTKAFRDFFVGKGIPEGMSLGFVGEAEGGSIQDFRAKMTNTAWFSSTYGEQMSSESRLSWGSGKIEVQNVLFNESPGPGDGAITLIVANEIGDTEQIYVSQAEFKNTSLGNYFNGTMFRTATAKNRAKNAGLEGHTFSIGGGLGQLTFDFTSAGAEYAIFSTPVTENGITRYTNPVSYLTTSPDFRAQMEDLDKQGLLPF